jgi:hypothetical protein
MKNNVYVLTLLFIITVISCKTGDKRINTLSKKEIFNGWELLFDGHSMEKWKMFNGGDVAGWKIVNGELQNSGIGSYYGGDIITKKQYTNFELYIEWKVAPQSHSGIFYHVEEGVTNAISETGPEYQLIDDLGLTESLDDKQKSGAVFGMFSPVSFVVKPANKWNETRLIVKDQHVEHWLNRKKVLEYELWGNEWITAKQNSEWAEAPYFGEAKSGHIGLQDHGGLTVFRNIKIRVL